MLKEKVFGTDGVRGKANYTPMTVETALALGRAAGKIFLSEEKRRHRVVIGKDTRLSCYMFENALVSGLCSMGIDTLIVGPFPTPGIAFITRAYRADAGIVISASHNPYYDNGIKFFSAGGYKLPDTWEEEMEKLIYRNDFSDALPSDYEIGRNKKVHDADGRYIEFAKATFPKKQSLRNLTIALDCANGAAYKVAPLIFSELDAKVVVTGNTPNGLNINENCGALYPNTVKKLLIENQADVGIALDGDADRVLMVDENGKIVDGDTILAICARDMKNKGQLRNNTIVSTIMSNFGFIKAMKNLGITVIQSQVGDRYVIQDMLKAEANLGGEQSGHLIFLDHNTTGDGLVSALQVLQIMIEKNAKLSELASFVEKYPQVLKNVKVGSKPPIENLKKFMKKKLEFEKDLGDAGQILVRYSGTEDICRIMVEGPDERSVETIAKTLAEIVNEEIGVR